MPKGTVLVTGGAGYIGSHAVLALLAAGRHSVVLDDLSTGRRELVPPEVPFVEADVADSATVRRTLRAYGCAAVMHFAGAIVVAESVREPLKYYRRNTCASRDLIAACVLEGIEVLVFSSTAAVYGNPPAVPVGEDAPLLPITAYGASKLATEWMLRDTAAATSLRYLALRYFNVAGADPSGRSGQCGPESTHLVKVACEAATGKRPSVTVFGTDYPTRDGTCVRDYIHVSDLARAHVAALDYLEAGGRSEALNCGYGRGFSVREVLGTVGAIAGTPLSIVDGPRRPGDPTELVADATRLRRALAWKPELDDLGAIVGSALAWERKLGPAPHRPPGKHG